MEETGEDGGLPVSSPMQRKYSPVGKYISVANWTLDTGVWMKYHPGTW